MGETHVVPRAPRTVPSSKPLRVLFAVVRTALRALFVIYVALNMLVCALLFGAVALPRETISGFFGRMSGTLKPGVCRKLARIGEFVVNVIYFWEENHCAIVYLQECDARRALYGDLHD